MGYKAVSMIDSLPHHEPPQYATRIPKRKPIIKFSDRLLARQAIMYRTAKRYDPVAHYEQIGWIMDDIFLYKYDPHRMRYDLIWDSKSELAEAFKRMEITFEEMYEEINW